MTRLSALAGLLFLTACAGFPALPYTAPTYFAYRCDAGTFDLRLGDEAALVLWNGLRIALPQVPAASGTQYRNEDGYLLWLKGDAARFETPDSQWSGCRGEWVDTPWRAAAIRGVSFRAIGNEPGWLVEIHPEFGGQIVLDAGTVVLPLTQKQGAAFPAPMTVAGRQIDFVIADEGCRDTMSGEYSPLMVTMTVDGIPYSGCGRRLD